MFLRDHSAMSLIDGDAPDVNIRKGMYGRWRGGSRHFVGARDAEGAEKVGCEEGDTPSSLGVGGEGAVLIFHLKRRGLVVLC